MVEEKWNSRKKTMTGRAGMRENRREEFLKRNWGLIYSLLSLLFDLALLNLSFVVSLLLNSGNCDNLVDYIGPLIFVNGLFLFGGAGLGIYRSRYNFSTKTLSYHYRRLVLFMAVLTMAFLYVIKGQGYSRQVMIVAFLIMYLFFELAFRLFRILHDYLAKKRWIGFKMILIGTDDLAWSFSCQIRDVFGEFYPIIGYIPDEREDDSYVNEEIAPSVLGGFGQLEDLIVKHNPDIVLINSEKMVIDNYHDIYKICRKYKVKLKVVSSKVTRILKYSRIRDVLGVTLVLESWRIHYWRFNYRLKRFFDLLFVFLISPVILLLSLVIAVIIKLTSEGPALFKQKRALHKDGHAFICYKFRSMYADAEELKDNFLEKNESNGALFKMKNDPRITPFGKILRKFSLDEIPQFINVLKGEMSLVGPRPLPVEDFENNKDTPINFKWPKHREIVKPGMTGLWQISGRSNLSYEEMLFLDLYYIENQSIFLDMEILFGTLPIIFFGRGAY
jgi:exopolysaccharide biosynthesis polyprenyl glycosylphosphotransferase